MTDTSYDLCPTCGWEEAADICPAMCGVEQEIENLVDDILNTCREKVAHAEAISGYKELNDRGLRRQNLPRCRLRTGPGAMQRPHLGRYDG